MRLLGPSGQVAWRKLSEAAEAAWLEALRSDSMKRLEGIIFPTSPTVLGAIALFAIVAENPDRLPSRRI
jgi:hypothetical protein